MDISSLASSIRLANFKTSFLGPNILSLKRPGASQDAEQDFARSGLLEACAWLDYGCNLIYFDRHEVETLWEEHSLFLKDEPIEFLKTYKDIVPEFLIRGFESLSNQSSFSPAYHHAISIDYAAQRARCQYQAIFTLAESLVADRAASFFLATALFSNDTAWNAATGGEVRTEVVASHLNNWRRPIDNIDTNSICAGFIRLLEHMSAVSICVNDLPYFNRGGSFLRNIVAWRINFSNRTFANRFRDSVNLVRSFLSDLRIDLISDKERQQLLRRFDESVDQLMNHWSDRPLQRLRWRLMRRIFRREDDYYEPYM